MNTTTKVPPELLKFLGDLFSEVEDTGDQGAMEVELPKLLDFHRKNPNPTDRDPIKIPKAFQGLGSILGMPSFSYENDGRGWNDYETYFSMFYDGDEYYFLFVYTSGDSGDDFSLKQADFPNAKIFMEVAEARKNMIKLYNGMNEAIFATYFPFEDIEQVGIERIILDRNEEDEEKLEEDEEEPDEGSETDGKESEEGLTPEYAVPDLTSWPAGDTYNIQSMVDAKGPIKFCIYERGKFRSRVFPITEDVERFKKLLEGFKRPHNPKGYLVSNAHLYEC